MGLQPSLFDRTCITLTSARRVIGLVCAVVVLWLIMNPAMPSGEDDVLPPEMQSSPISWTSELATIQWMQARVGDLVDQVAQTCKSDISV